MKPEKDRQERVPDVISTLNSHSSWVCRYQVAQMLDRHKGQRIASERMALSRRCLSRPGCMLYHHMHHAAASLFLDTLVLSHTRSAAQQQVWSCKTTAAAEACKIPGHRNLTVWPTVGTTVTYEFASCLRNQRVAWDSGWWHFSRKVHGFRGPLSSQRRMNRHKARSCFRNQKTCGNSSPKVLV